MKIYKIGLCLLAIFLCSAVSSAQTNVKKNIPAAQPISNPVKFTPAYAELLLRKAELEAEAESLLATYTEEYPKLKESRFELDLINKDLAKLLNQTEISKLTLALGKLLVRKNQLETDLWALQKQYGKDHPEVKRAQRKVISFQNSIREIF